MISDIIKAIALELKREFNSHKIYTEFVRQGVKKPCFFIQVNHADESGELHYKSKRIFKILIRYVSDVDFYESRIQDCNDVAERLLEHVEWIKVNKDILRMKNMKTRVNNEGILDFSASLTCYIEHKKEEEDMKKISLEVGAEFE